MSDFELAIIGSGSGNSLLTPYFDDRAVALVESGTFGGTCLNVGCIPTKMYVYAAEVATTVRGAARYGLDATLDGVRWPDIRDRIFGRIDPISAGGHRYRQQSPNVTLFDARARFVGERRLALSTGEQFSADQVVIATGSRPTVPAVIARSGVAFHTSDTVMRIDELPASLVIVGGGYIAAEFAHVFSALGVAVTVIARGGRLLRQLDSEISDRFTAVAAGQWDLRLGAKIESVTEAGGGVRLGLADGTEATGDLLLVATGREPNTGDLDLAAGGVTAQPDGRVGVDRFGRTNVAGVWTLGDCSSDYQLKHVANHEARVVAHNLEHPDDLREFDHRFVPAAVFTHPQIASVGLTEDQAAARGLAYRAVVQQYADTAYGWAMEDTTGICKLIADEHTGRLLGAHLMGYQASNLIQPLIQALSLGQSVTDVARGQYWIHPALMEVVENALLKLGF